VKTNLQAFLDSHEGYVEKDPEADCPFDLEIGKGIDSSPVLEATMVADGSHLTAEGIFIYRRCGKTACGAEVSMALNHNGEILDFARFVAPCTGKL
jgi:hypothetical protein